MTLGGPEGSERFFLFYYMVIAQYDFSIVSRRHGDDNHYPSGKTLQFH